MCIVRFRRGNIAVVQLFRHVFNSLGNNHVLSTHLVLGRNIRSVISFFVRHLSAVSSVLIRLYYGVDEIILSAVRETVSFFSFLKCI